ncbi:TrmH family RNA methyltransferase [Plebeiibacterium sediminum]|uniref:RNA methyltransferase n=1 Tax=Plebeiibacterium sediminum TaxID=2992112 RepID=A0AAE3M3B0_9BACT|nr:RNA methyltransferase [Plebeiobacterium sediminum]MCW3786216.1 RNA methyltransferase [Plebeiobacterium sediminum]
MISQSKIKLINSLSKKKYRDINQLFIAEGEKLVSDLSDSSIHIKWLFASKQWIEDHSSIIADEITECEESQLKKITQLKTPSPVIAICSIPDQKIQNLDIDKDLTLALDDIQDPGNLGTIIRLADWFGIKNIVCSQNTADAYNPKVIQATMGAIARVNLFYTDLELFLKQAREKNNSIYGTFLDGEDIYRKELNSCGIIVMGNEGKGISSKIESLVSDKLLIPSFSTNPIHSESLNVSTATAITLSEFRRRF